jgi:hypothetical protein
MISAPVSAFWKTPLSPSRTSWTSGESGTITQITSAPLTASPIEVAARPPAAIRASARSGVRSRPATVWPALARWTAIGLPMMPRPMKAMFVMSDLL